MGLAAKVLHMKSSLISHGVRLLIRKDLTILNKIRGKKEFFEGKVSLKSTYAGDKDFKNEEDSILQSWKLIPLTFTKCQYAMLKQEKIHCDISLRHFRDQVLEKVRADRKFVS